MKEPIIENKQLIIHTLHQNGKEYIEVDDVINWFKCLKKSLDKEWCPLLDTQIKTFIRMKNSKKL